MLRPQYGVVFKTVERRGHDIYIAIDTSKSMLAQDTQPSRLEHAKREVLGLIDELKGDRIGLIAFAGDAFIQCPLTTDYAALKMYLDFLDAGVVPTPGTDIATAIKTARLSFNRVSKGNKRVLIILSDGESFENDPVKSAEVAFDQDITIYTIGVGTPTGEPIPEFNEAGQLIGYKKDKQNQVVLSKINEGLLKQVAQTAEGHFSSSLGQFVMDEVYKDISPYGQKRLEEELLTLNKDQYQWFLAIAFLALLPETLLLIENASSGWLGRTIIIMKHVYIILSSFRYPLMASWRLSSIKSDTYYDQDYENALNETLSLQNNFPEEEAIIIIWAK